MCRSSSACGPFREGAADDIESARRFHGASGFERSGRRLIVGTTSQRSSMASYGRQFLGIAEFPSSVTVGDRYRLWSDALIPSRSLFRACIVAIVAALLASGSAQARNPAIRGPGTESCGAWTKERAPSGDQGARFDRESWIMGYVSAYNVFALKIDADVARGVDAKGLFAWLDNYSAAHPLDMLGIAANELVNELRLRGGWR
jgi:hypothetical protein